MEEKTDLERDTQLHRRSNDDYFCFVLTCCCLLNYIRLEIRWTTCQHRAGYFSWRSCDRVPFLLDYQVAHTVPKDLTRQSLYQAKMGFYV